MDDGGLAAVVYSNLIPSELALLPPRDLMTARLRTHLHFDLHFAPADIAARLHVGRSRMPLVRHTPETLRRYRRENAALRHLPDDRVTHYVEDVELPAQYVQHLLVTAPAEGGSTKLDTLLFSKIYVPRQARAQVVEQLIHDGHPNAHHPHPKFLAVGVPRTMRQDPAAIIDVHDWITAEDAAHSIISHHVELANILGTVAAKVLPYIENANGFSDLAVQILKQATEHLKHPGKQNWAFESPYLDTNLKPTSTYYYNWSGITKQWMRAPLRDSLNKTKNDPALESRGEQVGLYTVQQGIANVSTPQSATAPARQERAADDGGYWTANDLTPQHGFSQVGELSFDKGTFSITYNNSWLRWLSAYVEFLGPDRKAVTPVGWTSMLPGNLAATYDSDTRKYVQIFSATNTILGIPVGNTDTKISFPWPKNASSVRILAGGLGRTAGIESKDGKYVGGWDDQVCTPGAIMTGVFNLGIPAVSMLLGAAVPMSKLTELGKSILAPVLDVAGALVNGPVSSALQGGNTTTLITAFVDMIPRLLLDVPDLAFWMSVEFGEAAAEEATPIFGWIAMAVCEATNLALLLQTSTEVGLSPAVFEIDVSRAIDAEWSLLPDKDHHNTWPLEATHYEVIATFKDGTTRTTTGRMTSSPQTGSITVRFDSAHKNRLPGGGQVQFTANFYSDSGWLCGAVRTGDIDADIVDNLLTVPQMAITENLVPLTSTTVYQFDKKLAYPDGARGWSTAGAPTATVKALSNSNVGHNLAQLGNITLSQSTGEIGYSWQASGQELRIPGQDGPYSGQLFSFQAISNGDRPDDRLKFVPSGLTTKPLLVFDLHGPASGDGNNFWIDPREGAYHVRQVLLGKAGTFDFSTARSWGRFNQQIDAAAVHPSGRVVGISTANSRLEVLSLSSAVADAEAPLAEIYAGYGSRPGLLHGPIAVVANPTGAAVVVLETADGGLRGGAARLQAFDLSGNPAPIFGGKTSSVALLKDESRAATLLDLAIESKGYLYVLKYLGDGSEVTDYLLDVYNPDGSWLAQTAGLSAAKMCVDAWRTLYTVNFEVLRKPDGSRTEPSVSIWLPSPPKDGHSHTAPNPVTTIPRRGER